MADFSELLWSELARADYRAFFPTLVQCFTASNVSVNAILNPSYIMDL